MHFIQMAPYLYIRTCILTYVWYSLLFCRRAREDLKASNRRINTMLADYGDVVPRRDYERLEGSFQTLENEHEQLKNDHITLLEEQRFVCKCCGVIRCDIRSVHLDIRTYA